MTQTVAALTPPKTPAKEASPARGERLAGFDSALELEATNAAHGPEPPGADPPTDRPSARTAQAEGAESGSEAAAGSATTDVSDEQTLVANTTNGESAMADAELERTGAARGSATPTGAAHPSTVEAEPSQVSTGHAHPASGAHAEAGAQAGAGAMPPPAPTAAQPGPGELAIGAPSPASGSSATPSAGQAPGADAAPALAQPGAEDSAEPNTRSGSQPQSATRAPGSGAGGAGLSDAEQHNAVAAPTLAAREAPTGRTEASTLATQQLASASAAENTAAELRGPDAPRPTGELPKMHARLHDLGSRTETAIRLAVRDGHSFARITMRPPELGSIEIRLQYRGGEIVAEVRAENAQTLGMLSQTASDLRRQLEAQGITLADLQLRQSNSEDDRRDQAGRSTEENSRRGSTGAADDDTDDLAIEALRRHPAAVRLDVLA